MMTKPAGNQFKDVEATQPILATIVEKHGRTLLENESDCIGLLHDYFPDAKRARDVLLHLLRQRAPQRLLEMPGGISELNIERFAEKIAQEGDVPLAEDAARLGLTAWACALGIVVAPSSKPVATPRQPVAIVTKGVLTLTGHSKSVTSVAISPCGTLIASGSDDGRVGVWNFSTGQLVHRMRGRTGGLWNGSVTSVAFSPDGRSIASSHLDDRSVQFWNPETGDQFSAIILKWRPRSIAFSPNSSLVAVGDTTHGIVILDNSTFQSQYLKHRDDFPDIRMPNQKVNSVAFFRGGEDVIEGGDSGLITIWDRKSGFPFVVNAGVHFATSPPAINSVAVSPDGQRYLVGKANGVIDVYDAKKQNPHRFVGHPSAVTMATFTPDGRCIVSASADRTIKIWDAETATAVRTLEGHTAAVTAVCCTPDGRRIISGSQDRTIKIWDIGEAPLGG
jgi:WD40 repeat protein